MRFFFLFLRILLATFLTLFNNPGSYNLDLIHRPIFRPRLHKPHPLHNPQPTLDPPENRVFPIQPRRWRQRDEELTPIRVLPTIGHTQYPRPRMLQARIYLIFELFTIDGCATTSRTGGIASLQHEVRDDAVEDDVVVVPALGQSGEVVTGLENSLSVDLRINHKELGYLGGMVFIEFEGYGTLGAVSKICVRWGS